MKTVKRYGITGNIGSGKSLVCKIFEHLGISVFYCDDEIKALYLRPQIKELMTSRFGQDLYFDDGSLNRELLSSLIFEDKDALSFVETNLYKSLNQYFDEWSQQQDSPYILYESAILFEKSLIEMFDGIIFVSAPEPVRIQRVIKRDNCTEESIKSRMKLQWDEELKIKKADFVINNDGEHLVIPQVLKIHEHLKSAQK